MLKKTRPPILFYWAWRKQRRRLKNSQEAREELKNFGEKASFLLELMDFIVVRQF